MDYCSEKSLNFYLGRMGPIISINTKVFLLYQVSIGLRFLRDFGVTHLDVKPENLLLKTGMGANNKTIAILKMIDFG
jgi:serine/threonine protein kinase